MKVVIKHSGYSPVLRKHYYHILTENGHADMITDEVFVPNGEIEMNDDIWTEGSGWADIECDSCHTQYRERCRPGMVVACPVCSEPFLVPEGAILEDSNVEDF